MGHNTHFLSRLERVSPRDADTALGLYRNPRFVRAILTEFGHLERDDERVAIALGKDKQGPYVVVAMNGAFVTCLGKKMKTGDLYIIPREFIDARMKLHADYKKSWKLVFERGRETELEKLLARIARGAQRVCREDVEQFAPFMLAFNYDFLQAYYRSTRYLRDKRDDVVGIMQSTRNHTRGRFKRDRKQTFALHWQHAWFAANAHVMLTMNGVETIRYLDSEIPDPLSYYHVYAFREGVMNIAIRSLWGAGIRGKSLIESMQQYQKYYYRIEELFGAIASLAVVALRYPRLADDAVRVAEEIVRVRPDSEELQWHFELMTTVLERCDDPEISREQIEQGRKEYAELRAEVGCALSELRPHPDDAPERLLLQLGAHLSYDFRGRYTETTYIYRTLPWLARIDANELFLPRHIIDAIGFYDDHVYGEQLIARHVARDYRFKTHRSARVARRNDPCPCDSGKKYKQCCEPEHRHAFYVDG